MSNSSLLHYRAWQGEFRGAGWSVWPIARVAVAMIVLLDSFVAGAGMAQFFIRVVGVVEVDET